MKAAHWTNGLFELESIGGSGRVYSMAVVDQAEIDAARGDASAQAILDDIEAASALTDADLRRVMERIMADCPCCQEALARGEVPIMGTGADLRARYPQPERPANWWHGKRPKKNKARPR